jgi:hypothetical protein
VCPSHWTADDSARCLFERLNLLEDDVGMVGSYRDAESPWRIERLADVCH